MLHHVCVPKSVSKSRKAVIVSQEDGSKWINLEEVLRLFEASPLDVLNGSEQFRHVLKLIELHHGWSNYQEMYRLYRSVFESKRYNEVPMGYVTHWLLRNNMHPSDLLSRMDLTPYITLLKTTAKPPASCCVFCGTAAAKLRCSACKQFGCLEVIYCNKECQASDWKQGHKELCCKTRLSAAEKQRTQDFAADATTARNKARLLEHVMRMC